MTKYYFNYPKINSVDAIKIYSLYKLRRLKNKKTAVTNALETQMRLQKYFVQVLNYFIRLQKHTFIEKGFMIIYDEHLANNLTLYKTKTQNSLIAT